MFEHMGEKSTNICRICLLEIVETEQHYFLNNDNKLMLQFKLLKLLPKIDLNITTNPIACNKCMITIEEIYEFKQLCIQTETTIRNSRQQGAIKEELHDDNIKVELSNLQMVSDKYLEINKEVPVCIEESSETEMYYCYNCNFNTNKKTILIKHLVLENVKLQHNSGKPFKCNICDHACNTKSALKIHIRKHTSEKPFKCNICDYCSTTKWSLKRHMCKHTGEKPVKCNICDYGCTTKATLKVHLRKHTGEKRFKCNICDHCSTTKWDLKLHKRKHTGEKPFKCNICDYRCNQSVNLKRHMHKHTWKTI
ncbi:hypothetical protein RN001_014025 [Aquatica leii]|uniref:Protein hunchback n=1 Tax=Aquatica leii TaxID=1421715 RepID=A0AAN7SNY3_9COLE|nr:hypothetical protein RN001_014025 [Aquatica leii]